MIALILVAAFVLYLVAAIFVTRWLVKRASSGKAKWVTGLVSALVFFLIPTWDHILGAIYFRYLCNMEGGITVYKTVELRPEHWNSDGTPRFITRSSYLDKQLLEGRYMRKKNFEDHSYDPFRITLDEDIIAESQSGERLGKKTSFIYFGGWVANNTGAHVVGSRCHSYQDISYEEFLLSIFKPGDSAVSMERGN
jgi:hypothetical protein